MAYRQDGPVPEQVRFTLRVDADTNPALAEFLWRMPWGARNPAVVELLELGYRAKQGGLTLPTQAATPRQPLARADEPEAPPASDRTNGRPVKAVPANATTVAAIPPASTLPVDRHPTPLASPPPEPAAPQSPETSIAGATAQPPAVAEEPPTAEAPDTAPEDEAGDEQSSVSILLGQFGG